MPRKRVILVVGLQEAETGAGRRSARGRDLRPRPARPRARHQLPVGHGGSTFQPLSRELPQPRVTGTRVRGSRTGEFSTRCSEGPFPAWARRSTGFPRRKKRPISGFSYVDAGVAARFGREQHPGHIRDVGFCRRDGPHGRLPSGDQGARHRLPVPEPFMRRSTRHEEES